VETLADVEALRRRLGELIGRPAVPARPVSFWTGVRRLLPRPHDHA
jgi:hypothetical protein